MSSWPNARVLASLWKTQSLKRAEGLFKPLLFYNIFKNRLTDDELQTACQPLIEWVEAKTEERIMKEIDEVEGAMRDAKEKEERRDIRKRKIARISEKVNVTMTTDDDRPKRKFEMAASDLPVIADGEIVLSIDKRPPLKSPGSPKGDEEDSLDSDDDDYAAMAKICIPPKDYSALYTYSLTDCCLWLVQRLVWQRHICTGRMHKGSRGRDSLYRTAHQHGRSGKGFQIAQVQLCEPERNLGFFGDFERHCRAMLSIKIGENSFSSFLFS